MYAAKGDLTRDAFSNSQFNRLFNAIEIKKKIKHEMTLDLSVST